MVCGARWGAVFYMLSLTVLNTNADTGRKKDRDVSGLYPFPRVGRSEAFESDLNEFVKREGLIPFPRVGRGGITLGKRGEIIDGSAFWLGPRMAPQKAGQWTVLQSQDPPAKGTPVMTMEVADGRILDDISGPENVDQGPSSRIITW